MKLLIAGLQSPHHATPSAPCPLCSKLISKPLFYFGLWILLFISVAYDYVRYSVLGGIPERKRKYFRGIGVTWLTKGRFQCPIRPKSAVTPSSENVCALVFIFRFLWQLETAGEWAVISRLCSGLLSCQQNKTEHCTIFKGIEKQLSIEISGI